MKVQILSVGVPDGVGYVVRDPETGYFLNHFVKWVVAPARGILVYTSLSDLKAMLGTRSFTIAEDSVPECITLYVLPLIGVANVKTFVLVNILNYPLATDGVNFKNDFASLKSGDSSLKQFLSIRDAKTFGKKSNWTVVAPPLWKYWLGVACILVGGALYVWLNFF